MLRNTLLSITVLTAAFIIAACGSSSDPVEVQPPASASAPAIPAPVGTVAAARQPPATNPPVVDVKIGNSVGDHVPDFEFSLADGTKVNAASLIEQAEPAYLFFFATW
jgi:hypothetical protein